MQVILGRRLYFNKITGMVLYDTGERVGENIVDTTVEEDFQYSLELRKYDPAIIDHIQLEPGQYNVEFSEAVSYRVNPKTKELEFGYTMKDTSVFMPPYKDMIAEMERRAAASENALAQMLMERGPK